MNSSKKKMIIAFLGMALLTGILPPVGQTRAYAQSTVSFQVFYDQLSPFGNWVDYSDYGYVWVPAANSGFRPYGTRGHWVYSDEGWVWVSDYSWGWATFHYGNWFYDNTYGWMWLPGYEWAPAWVTWGEYDGDYCWAPVGPRIDIGVSFGTYRPAYNYWNFCPRGHIADINVSHYFVNHIHNTTVVSHITVINNVNRGGGRGAYLRGPAPASVERFTHTSIRPVAIQTSSRPGTASMQRGQLSIYRPVVRNYNGGARPARVQDLHALRPANRVQAQAPVASNNHTATQERPVQQHAVQQHPVQRPVDRSIVNQHSTSRPANQYPVHHTVVQQRPAQMQQRPAQRQITQHPVDHTVMQQHQTRSMTQQPRPMQQHSFQQPATVQRSMPVQHQAPRFQPRPAVQPRPAGMPLVRNQPPPQGPRENSHDHHR